MAWSMSALCALALVLTCGLQVITAKVHQSNHVSSVCSMWGNFHFKMFDGDVYQFQGTCEYNLVSDCHGPVQGFSVHVKRSGTPGISKITRVLVTIEGIAFVLTKNIVMVNNDIVNLPHYVAGVMLEENSIYIKLYAKLGLSVTWNKDDAVMLELDTKYVNRTCGLCGDYNGVPVVNEFLSDGRVTGFIEFGNNHRVHSPNDVCEDPYEEFENEDNTVDKCQSFREECSELLLDESWSFCRNILSPEPYIHACMMDTCASGPGDTDVSTSFCSTLSEYSRQCSHAGGKPPNWRTPAFCAMTCPFNMEYSESGSPCLDTCTHTDTSSLCAEHKMDGCFCPPGTVFDDISERGCIPQEQCQCKHNKVYNTGEVLRKDDEECVCHQGRWICKSLSLPGVCAIEEGSHFTTFDGKEFTFHGRCSYVLSKDCVGSKFIILGQLIPCVPHHTDTCLKSIVLMLNNDKSNAIIIKDDGIIRHNGDIKLPYTTADFTIFRPSSFYIILQTTFGLHLYVQLVPIMQLYITLDQSFQSYTCGLCGNFNTVLYDELLTPQGVVEGTATSFANSWKAQSNCPDQRERLDDPCSYSIDSESYAEHWCSKLKDKEDIFAKCHSAVNPESYYKRCKYSSCTCEKSEDCLCAVFSSYVRACRAKGVFLQRWRDTVCEKYTKSCPATQIFNYNVQQCQRTCDSLSLERQGCSTDYVPVDGCACPAGLYESVNGVCVTMDKCPCYHNGEHFKPGKSINIKNDHCICTNGKLQCQSQRSRITGCPAPKVFFNCSTAGPDEHGIECAQTCAQKNVDCYPTGCESGCKCPEDLLDDGRGFCVKEHDCPCKHDNHFYASGSEIMDECNKCICKHGEWDCTNNKCPGTCTIYGSGHYNTFDKQRFGFSGFCSYMAVQNNCGNQTRTFHVITENVPCGTTGTTCSKAVRIILGRTELELRDGKMTEIKAETGLSIKFNVRYVGLYLVIDSEIGLTVLWDFKTTVRIILQPYHMGKVCGLCGNFNGNAKDDFTTQDSLHVSDVMEFVNSWKLDSNCPSANRDFDPCIQAQNRENWAKLQCSIIKSDIFKACHDKVEWTPYYENCVRDSCACDTGGDCECFCTAVAAYAQACNEAEVCVAWRTPEICPVFCDYYNHLNECIWHYSPCETPCYKTCLNPNGICTNPLPHLEGCYPKCPEDKPIFDEKNQVCVEECPGCFINGTEYTPGEEIPTKIPCNFCYCHENGSEICFLRPGCCFYNGTEYNDNDVIYNVTDNMGTCYYAICINNTVNNGSYPCGVPTTTPITATSTVPTPAPTTTPVYTTTTVTTTVTHPTTVGSTTVSETTPCIICEWTDWINVYDPAEGGGNDLETYENIKNSGKEICKQPEDIKCRNVQNPDLSLDEFVQSTGQVVQCNVSFGLVCEKRKQTQRPYKCFDYEINVLCCRECDFSTTNTPVSTTSQHTTTKSSTTSEGSTTIKTESTSSSGTTTKPTTTVETGITVVTGSTTRKTTPTKEPQENLTTTPETEQTSTTEKPPSTISTTTAKTSTTPETVPTSTTGKTTKPTTTPLTTTESTASQQTVTTTPSTISTTTAKTSTTPKTVPTSTTGKTTKPTTTPLTPSLSTTSQQTVTTTPSTISTTTAKTSTTPETVPTSTTGKTTKPTTTPLTTTESTASQQTVTTIPSTISTTTAETSTTPKTVPTSTTEKTTKPTTTPLTTTESTTSQQTVTTTPSTISTTTAKTSTTPETVPTSTTGKTTKPTTTPLTTTESTASQQTVTTTPSTISTTTAKTSTTPETVPTSTTGKTTKPTTTPLTTTESTVSQQTVTTTPSTISTTTAETSTTPKTVPTSTTEKTTKPTTTPLTTTESTTSQQTVTTTPSTISTTTAETSTTPETVPTSTTVKTTKPTTTPLTTTESTTSQQTVTTTPSTISTTTAETSTTPETVPTSTTGKTTKPTTTPLTATESTTSEQTVTTTPSTISTTTAKTSTTPETVPTSTTGKTTKPTTTPLTTTESTTSQQTVTTTPSTISTTTAKTSTTPETVPTSTTGKTTKPTTTPLTTTESTASQQTVTTTPSTISTTTAKTSTTPETVPTSTTGKTTKPTTTPLTTTESTVSQQTVTTTPSTISTTTAETSTTPKTVPTSTTEKTTIPTTTPLTTTESTTSQQTVTTTPSTISTTTAKTSTTPETVPTSTTGKTTKPTTTPLTTTESTTSQQTVTTTPSTISTTTAKTSTTPETVPTSTTGKTTKPTTTPLTTTESTASQQTVTTTPSTISTTTAKTSTTPETVPTSTTGKTTKPTTTPLTTTESTVSQQTVTTTPSTISTTTAETSTTPKTVPTSTTEKTTKPTTTPLTTTESTTSQQTVTTTPSTISTTTAETSTTPETVPTSTTGKTTKPTTTPLTTTESTTSEQTVTTTPSTISTTTAKTSTTPETVPTSTTGKTTKPTTTPLTTTESTTSQQTVTTTPSTISTTTAETSTTPKTVPTSTTGKTTKPTTTPLTTTESTTSQQTVTTTPSTISTTTAETSTTPKTVPTSTTEKTTKPTTTPLTTTESTTSKQTVTTTPSTTSTTTAKTSTTPETVPTSTTGKTTKPTTTPLTPSESTTSKQTVTTTPSTISTTTAETSTTPKTVPTSTTGKTTKPTTTLLTTTESTTSQQTVTTTPSTTSTTTAEASTTPETVPTSTTGKTTKPTTTPLTTTESTTSQQTVTTTPYTTSTTTAETVSTSITGKPIEQTTTPLTPSESTTSKQTVTTTPSTTSTTTAKTSTTPETVPTSTTGKTTKPTTTPLTPSESTTSQQTVTTTPSTTSTTTAETSTTPETVSTSTTGKTTKPTTTPLTTTESTTSTQQTVTTTPSTISTTTAETSTTPETVSTSTTGKTTKPTTTPLTTTESTTSQQTVTTTPYTTSTTTAETVSTSTTGKTTKPTTTPLTTTESTTSKQTVTTTPSTISTTTAETSTTPKTVPTSTTGKTTKPTTTPLTTTESTTSQQTVTTTPSTISTTTAETSTTPETVPTSTTGKTTKPTTTPVVSTTPTSIPTTTECFCIINGVHYEPGKPIFEDKDIGSGVCLSMFCSDSCLILNTTRPCPTTATPPPPPKNCTEWGVEENEIFEICNCTLARCIENNTVEIIPYECPPLQNITCSNGKQPVLVPDEYHCCEEYACDCFCEGWGDPHYITFDGRFYSHQGECTYVLMEEIRHKHHLKIYIDNVNCDPRESVSCPRSIIVSYHNKAITLKNHNLLGAAKLEALMGNSPLKLPFEEKGLRVLSSGLTLILQIPKLNVVVMFGVTGFSVNLPFKYFGNNTQGHCGTCNNNKADDCMLPGGKLVDDCAVMANYWQAKDLNNPECKPPPEEPETVAPTKAPCPINAVCELLKSDLFKECHPHVSPQNYFTGCQFDSCHISNPTVVCTSVQTYAKACSQAGVCINWREHTDICTAECPADKVYMPCGPADPPTCKDKPDDHFMNVTTEGCFCPDGTKLFSKESGVCVDKCGCLDPSGQGREFGEKFQYGCQDCVCDESSVSIICKPRQCSNDSNQLTCSDPGFIVTNVTDPSDACCTIRTCSCDSSTCPSVNAKCSPGYTPVFNVPEGKCCPEYTCEPKRVCVHKGLEYEPGTSIPVIACQECRCTNDVDPNTQLYKVQCGMVTCKENCEPGYSYVESDTYECCGKCVKTQCVLNYNGTVQILENGAEWTPSNDACDKFICTMTDGEYVTTHYKIQCPPFNISNCQPGTVQLSSNRCCQVCVDMDSGCKVQTSFDYITHNNCRSKTTVEQTHCEGHCDSYSKYTELGSSSCSCCQASRTSKHTVSLDCENGDTINHTYLHVEACSCDQTKCLGKSQSTPTLTEDTRRRRSFRLP
ncbi:mucin-2-like isoform X1 [Tachysurus vachellii]|uniref:mucin-2-like isoform X1 n=1 Tax=Tachysurus vachellii TaxID=175792 RepID=UPI00296ADCF6|nr:mucin-2-like isoform X1 [Tachysurus vachellii]